MDTLDKSFLLMGAFIIVVSIVCTIIVRMLPPEQAVVKPSV
jgi:hypothetical protein